MNVRIYTTISGELLNTDAKLGQCEKRRDKYYDDAHT